MAEFPTVDFSDFDNALSATVSEVLKTCDLSRAAVAAKMSELLGEPRLTHHMLNAYASPTHAAHVINLKRFIALVHVTKSKALLQKFLLDYFGLIAVGQEELKWARLGRLCAEIDSLEKIRQAVRAEVSHGA
jgi:hypothetical protein